MCQNLGGVLGSFIDFLTAGALSPTLVEGGTYLQNMRCSGRSIPHDTERRKWVTDV